MTEEELDKVEDTLEALMRLTKQFLKINSHIFI